MNLMSRNEWEENTHTHTYVFVITGQPVRTARRYVYVSDMYLYVIVWVYFVYNKWYRLPVCSCVNPHPGHKAT